MRLLSKEREWVQWWEVDTPTLCPWVLVDGVTVTKAYGDGPPSRAGLERRVRAASSEKRASVATSSYKEAARGLWPSIEREFARQG